MQPVLLPAQIDQGRLLAIGRTVAEAFLYMRRLVDACELQIAQYLGLKSRGAPLTVLTFFTDTPRALAVSPDKTTVYVAGFKSGSVMRKNC